MSLLEELRRRRSYECRLTPDRALESLDEADVFLRERGLLTRTPDSSLPSLYEACHEEPYAPSAGGFGDWPRTKWRWAGALAERPGVYVLKIHRGKNLFLTEETAGLADPICRAELARMEQADPEWARLLRHLRAAGPSELQDLRTELGLKPKELKHLRYPLERCGALVSRQLVLETSAGGHEHTSELARWDQVFPEPAQGAAELDELILAGVRAAVVAPEHELARWFSWPWRFREGLVEDLVEAGRLERPEAGWVTAPESP
jgi:hypothetical protein